MPGERGLRLLFINHWAARMGGAEHSLVDLLEEASRRAEVFLVTSEPGVLVNRARTLGVTVVMVPCASSLGAVRRNGLFMTALRHWPGVLSFVRYVMRVRAVVAKVRPHVIHANVPKSHLTLFLLARLGFAGTCCFHLREIFDRGSAPWRLYSLLFPKRNGFVIAISKAVFAMLPPPLQRAGSVIYNGVEISPDAGEDTVKTGAPRRFLYLGRVVPWKGCHHLIEAFSLLYTTLGQRCGTLDIIGDTMYWDQSYRRELETLIARSGCAAVCRLLPHTTEPLQAFRDHDVFCIASENEPFGRVVAEAMGCGLPAIGFAAGGLMELIEPETTGILVPPGDGVAMASAMRRFIDNPELVRVMGSAARRRAETLFDRKVQVTRIVDVLMKEAGAGGIETPVL
jgi:L-malate glycosyltransferase